VAYRPQITEALQGEHKFSAGPISMTVNIGKVGKYDELWGGFCLRNLEFTRGKNGEIVGKVENPLKGQRVAIIDIGGGTVSGLVINADNGLPEYGKAHSETGVGMNHAAEQLSKALKADFSDVFRHVPDIDPSILRRAMREGSIKVSGKPLDVSKQVKRAVADTLTAVDRMFKVKMDAGLGIDTVLVTGGGGGALLPQLARLTDRDDILPACDQLEEMIYANVAGAARLFEVMRFLEPAS
jgi:hypothetical protein